MLTFEDMKRFLAVFFLLLAALLPLAGQNNPYEIDDECYKYYQQAELSVTDTGSDTFEKANAKLLETALARKDEKARTLYYVEALKRTSRMGRVAPESERNRYNKEIEAAREKLQEVARQTGYIQYYYYAFDLSQTYYFNTGQTRRAHDLLNEMIRISEAEGDEYGLWQAVRFIAQLYQRQGDLTNTRRYLRRGLNIWEHSQDPALRRQSVSRMYNDLADTYDIGTDSARLFYNKAWQAANQNLDTLRCTFYSALQAAFDKDEAVYRKDRDLCLRHPSFKTLFPTGGTCFRAVDGILAGEAPSKARMDSVTAFKQRHFLGRLAYKYELLDAAYYLTYAEAASSQSTISAMNNIRVDELSSQWEKSRMSAELNAKSAQVQRVTRLLMVLTLVILLCALVFAGLHIRQLNESKRRDKKRIEELKEANERVRLADAAKTRFVQNMSHEVRTPLNAIVGFSQLLALPDGTFPPEEKDEFSGHIINNTKMLTMLLDDILNASAMDSGNYRISYEEGEMHFIAQAAISSAEHRLQPGVRMYYAPESEEPFRFRTDPRRVQQILINLLTNSCKHTEKGEIRLASSLTACPGYVTYTVTDTGSGIPPEEAERIFERFTKLNDFVQGTGLGLSICRDIAGRMGARVYLDTSYREGGARFVFEVPVEPEGEEILRPAQDDKVAAQDDKAATQDDNNNTDKQ